jgi:arylsulfatase A-like enzyme
MSANTRPELSMSAPNPVLVTLDDVRYVDIPTAHSGQSTTELANRCGKNAPRYGSALTASMPSLPGLDLANVEPDIRADET